MDEVKIRSFDIYKYNRRRKYEQLAILYSKFFACLYPIKTVNWEILL